MKSKTGGAMSELPDWRGGLQDPKSHGGEVWKFFNRRPTAELSVAEARHDAQIRRILRRQEMAHIGFVCACAAAGVLILMAIWFEFSS